MTVDPPVPAGQPTVTALEAQTNAAMRSSSSPDYLRPGRLWRPAAHSYHSCPRASSGGNQAIAVVVYEVPETLKGIEGLDAGR